MRTRLRLVLEGTVALFAGFGLSMLLSQAMKTSAGTDPPDGLPRDPATRSALRQQLEQSLSRRSAEGGPKLRLPEDQRAGWIAAWNRMRDCARVHGFDGVTPVAPTFGDGETPAPVLFGSQPAMAAALESCPMDTSLFDADEVAAAIRPTGPE